MGLFDGTGLGGPSQPSGLGGLLGGIAGYNPGYPYSGQQAMSPEQQASMAAMQARQQAPWSPTQCIWPVNKQAVKHVESRVLTPMEVATKQIEGAVQAVVGAQESVRGRKMSQFDNWFENNPTSCDAKTSHIEGRIFVLRWVLEKIGPRSPDGRKGCQDSVDLLKEDVEKELRQMLNELPK